MVSSDTSLEPSENGQPSLLDDLSGGAGLGRRQDFGLWNLSAHRKVETRVNKPTYGTIPNGCIHDLE